MSGGKDSDVILQLAKEAGIPFRAIHKCTTIDPPGTLKHVKELGCEIIQPKKTFFELVREHGMPSRWYRFCCGYLKEYYTAERQIIGVRKDESTRRAKRYHEPEECRVYSKTKKCKQYYPILDWTSADVERFIKERGIKCHPLYYDEQGKFHVERRLGCIGCPLQSSNKIINEFKKYPKMLKLWISNMQIYLDNHKDTKTYNLTRGSAYNQMFLRLFCDAKISKYQQLIGGGYSEMN